MNTYNKKYKNRQRRYIIVTLISLILMIGTFIHDYFEKVEYPQTIGFIDVDDFIGAHILTKMTRACDTFASQKEQIIIEWEAYSEEMMFKYTKTSRDCENQKYITEPVYIATCFLDEDVEIAVKNTIHQLTIMRQDSLTERGVPTYQYSLSVQGNIEPITWQTSRDWTEFELLSQRIRRSCPNIMAVDLY